MPCPHKCKRRGKKSAIAVIHAPRRYIATKDLFITGRELLYNFRIGAIIRKSPAIKELTLISLRHSLQFSQFFCFRDAAVSIPEKMPQEFHFPGIHYPLNFTFTFHKMIFLNSFLRALPPEEY
jgi:hypothetical protein